MQNVYLLDKDGGSPTLENKRGYHYENKDGNQIGYSSDQYELKLNELKHDCRMEFRLFLNTSPQRNARF